MYRKLILLVLLVALIPAAQVAEWVSELAAGRDCAYGAAAGQPNDTEHGCTALEHACPCHVNAPAEPPPVAVAIIIEPVSGAVAMPAQAEQPGRSAEPPPLRPPIA